MRDLYDLYSKKINWDKQGSIQSKVFYVKCDCGHLAIRKNRSHRAIFRCSLCKKEYEVRVTGKVRTIGQYK